jgi:hypothetical protein
MGKTAMLVASESRCRIGIGWYDDEDEAVAAARRMFEVYPPESISAANLGYVQVGRDTGFDYTKNGVKLYAVVTP